MGFEYWRVSAINSHWLQPYVMGFTDTNYSISTGFFGILVETLRMS